MQKVSLIKHSGLILYLSIIWGVGELILVLPDKIFPLSLIQWLCLILHSVLLYSILLLIFFLFVKSFVFFLFKKVNRFRQLKVSLRLSSSASNFIYPILLVLFIISFSKITLNNDTVSSKAIYLIYVPIIFTAFFQTSRYFRKIGVLGVLLILIYMSFFKPAYFKLYKHLEIENTALKNKLNPNVLLISIDTLRADHLGCYGASEMHTPNLDYLSKRGAIYQHFITPIPLTVPAHATMLTGLYPLEHGSHSNGAQLENISVNLPSILAKLGYKTAAVVSGYPLKKDFFSLYHYFQSYDDKFSPWWFPRDEIFSLPIVRMLAKYGIIYDRRYIFEQRGNMILSKTKKLLKTKSTPFFLFLHYYEPHGPYEPPKPYGSYYIQEKKGINSENSMKGILFPAYQRLRHVKNINIPLGKYRGEITYVDSLVGKLLQTVFSPKQLQKMLFILTADHGESLGEHNYYFDHGKDCYVPSTHIPLIINYPQKTMEKVETQFTSLAELVPLTLKALFLHVPQKAKQYLSFSQVKNNEIPHIPIEANSNLLTHSAKASSISLKAYMEGVQYGDFKYLKVFSKAHHEYLFNILDDNKEKLDVSNKYPEIFEKLRSWNEKWQGKKKNKSTNFSLSHENINRLKNLGYIQ